MSKIEEAVAKIPRKTSGPGCSVGMLLERLPKEERDALARLVDPNANPRIPSTNLQAAISNAYGEDIHRSSVDRHRRNDCRCGRSI
jgi:hypothetical protein